MRSSPLVVAPLFLACQSIASSDVKTSGIYAALAASSDGTTTALSARLKTGGALSNTFLDLQNGDSLTAYSGTDSAAMVRNTLLGEVWYTASFAPGMGDTPLRVDFERAHDAQTQECLGGSAPNSLATLPAPFALGAPASGATFSRAHGGVTVSWSPSGGSDSMSYDVSGNCILPLNGSTADTGSVVLTPSPLQASTSSGALSNCAITIALTRSRSGKVDPAFGEGGAFDAAQVRSVVVQSTP
jgi:hypothetical protein